MIRTINFSATVDTIDDEQLADRALAVLQQVFNDLGLLDGMHCSLSSLTIPDAEIADEEDANVDVDRDDLHPFVPPDDDR